MHICYLTTDYHSTAVGGGIASYVSSMADAMTTLGHNVTVITLGRHNRSSRKGSIQVREVASPNTHWYLYRALPIGKSLALPIRELEWSHRLWSALLDVSREDPVDIVETGELAVFCR